MTKNAVAAVLCLVLYACTIHAKQELRVEWPGEEERERAGPVEGGEEERQGPPFRKPSGNVVPSP